MQTTKDSKSLKKISIDFKDHTKKASKDNDLLQKTTISYKIYKILQNFSQDFNGV